MFNRTPIRAIKPATPMAALLNAMAYPDGQCWPLREQHWRTITKAQRLGLLDANQYLTPKGRALIAAHFEGV